MALKQKKNKLIIVVWKWAESTNDQPLPEGDDRDFLLVDGNPGAQLVRYDSNKIGADASISELNKIIQENQETHDILVFLHVRHGYKDHHVHKLNPKGLVVPPILFGSSGHIYLSQFSKLGLLGVHGNLGADVNRVPIDSFFYKDGKVWIKNEHFKSVWDYYVTKFKQDVYSYYHDFVRSCIPAILSGNNIINPDTKQILNKALDKLSRDNVEDVAVFNISLNDDNPDGGRSQKSKSQVVYDERDKVVDFIKELRKELSIFLDKKDVTQADYYPLNYAFINLLNALPEKTYD